MDINSDFTQRVLVHTDDIDWTPSPMAGVDRRMLDRIGGEVARATSIVRYAKGSRFSAHTHTGGEEFIVLEGVFQDEHGDYPAGTYVRNPPTTAHTPGSEDGCIILVKLWQFDMDDRNQFRKDMKETLGPESKGIAVGELHKDARETVTYQSLKPGATLSVADEGGIEIYVLSGSLSSPKDNLPKGAWLRLPDGETLEAVAGPEGAKVWIKTGHLPYAKAPTV